MSTEPLSGGVPSAHVGDETCPQPADAKFWTVHVHGPDDVIPFDTEDGAECYAAAITDLTRGKLAPSSPLDPMISAHVIPPSGPVEPVADTEAVEAVSRDDLGKALRWAQYRDWSISDEEHEAVENLTDDAWNALTARPRLRPVENGLIRPSSSTREDGEPPTLAELHARYLAARQHTLSTDGMQRDDAIEAQALYVLGEASELHMACKGGAPWGTQRNQREEIADVVLAAVSLANILGVTVENCITEKTESDRGRG